MGLSLLLIQICLMPRNRKWFFRLGPGEVTQEEGKSETEEMLSAIRGHHVPSDSNCEVGSSFSRPPWDLCILEDTAGDRAPTTKVTKTEFLVNKLHSALTLPTSFNVFSPPIYRFWIWNFHETSDPSLWVLSQPEVVSSCNFWTNSS